MFCVHDHHLTNIEHQFDGTSNLIQQKIFEFSALLKTILCTFRQEEFLVILLVIPDNLDCRMLLAVSSVQSKEETKNIPWNCLNEDQRTGLYRRTIRPSLRFLSRRGRSDLSNPISLAGTRIFLACIVVRVLRSGGGRHLTVFPPPRLRSILNLGCSTNRIMVAVRTSASLDNLGITRNNSERSNDYKSPSEILRSTLLSGSDASYALQQPPVAVGGHSEYLSPGVLDHVDKLLHHVSSLGVLEVLDNLLEILVSFPGTGSRHCQPQPDQTENCSCTTRLR